MTDTESTFGTVDDLLNRAFADPFTRPPVRPATRYGKVRLSVQGGTTAYSTPRENLPDIRDYSHVEIGFLIDGEGLSHPSEAGIEGFDHLFEDGRSPVAGYVAWADVDALIAAIVAKYGEASEAPDDPALRAAAVIRGAAMERQQRFRARSEWPRKSNYIVAGIDVTLALANVACMAVFGFAWINVAAALGCLALGWLGWRSGR